MKKCPRCGSLLLESSDRCFTCGTTVQDSGSPAETDGDPGAPLNPYAPPEAELAVEGAEGAEMALVAIPLGKVVGMSIVTFGLYHLAWHYRQWKRLKETGDDVWPIPRAIFGGITFFFLVNRILDKLRFHDCPTSLGYGTPFLYFICQFFWRLPGVWSLTGVLTILPLVTAQTAINKLNRHLGYPDPKAEIGPGTIVAIGFGLVLWLFFALGIYIMMENPGG